MLDAQQEKMEEYVACGARLGWLLEPDARRAFVHRPGRAAETIDDATTLSGDPELPGLVVDLPALY
jgi:hypothetical protein